MRLFFKGKGFKIILTILLALILLLGISFIVGKTVSPQSGFLATIVSPFQKISTSVSNGINDFFTSMDRLKTLEKENNELRDEIRDLRSQVIDIDKYKNENEFYKGFLELKENHSDFKFEAATVIAADSVNAGKTFTVDKGSVHNISLHDPVITSDGLIGYISEVQSTYAIVTTVLDPSISIGAIDSRTRETGIVCGDSELFKNKLCRISYLNRSTTLTVGDYIITSGTGGVFPSGIIVGSVSSVNKEADGMSVYAIVKPIVDFDDLSDVMIITEFNGQGQIN